jgi:hypothetical protein
MTEFMDVGKIVDKEIMVEVEEDNGYDHGHNFFLGSYKSSGSI